MGLEEEVNILGSILVVICKNAFLLLSLKVSKMRPGKGCSGRKNAMKAVSISVGILDRVSTDARPGTQLDIGPQHQRQQQKEIDGSLHVS